MSGAVTAASAAIQASISGFGAAAADLINANGATQAAAAFGTAASLADTNAGIEEQSTKIQQVQAQRQINQTLGAQRAEVAGAGFEESGSSLALLASSSQQGALTTALIGTQGQILANGYTQQAAAYTAEQVADESTASADRSSANFAKIGAVGSAITAVAEIGASVAAVA